jgi:uncharacterized protein
MAIILQGEFEVRRSPEDVYNFLVDPNKFAPLLPEFQGMSVHDASHFTVRVNVGISHIKGVASVKMELAEDQRPNRAQYKGQGSVAGGSVAFTAGFDLMPLDTGTKIAWRGEARVFGRLASIAGGLLEPLGKKNVKKLIDSLQSALTQTETQPPEVQNTEVRNTQPPHPVERGPEPQ